MGRRLFVEIILEAGTYLWRHNNCNVVVWGAHNGHYFVISKACSGQSAKASRFSSMLWLFSVAHQHELNCLEKLFWNSFYLKKMDNNGSRINQNIFSLNVSFYLGSIIFKINLVLSPNVLKLFSSGTLACIVLRSVLKTKDAAVLACVILKAMHVSVQWHDRKLEKRHRFGGYTRTSGNSIIVWSLCEKSCIPYCSINNFIVDFEKSELTKKLWYSDIANSHFVALF